MPIVFTKPLFLFFLLIIPVVWVMMNRLSYRRTTSSVPVLVGIARSLVILLLVLALSGPRIVRSSDRVNLFFLLDASESIPDEAQKAALGYLRETMADKKEEDRAGMIVFGKEPSLEIALRKDFDPLEIKSQVNRNFTDIRGALQLAIGKLPEEGSNRIVLMTDGNETMEKALEMAYLARSLGVGIYPLPLTTWFHGSEVYIEKMDTPRSIPLETPFHIRLVIESTHETGGELILLRNGSVMVNREVTLKPGKNILHFTDTLTDQGLYLYRAIVNASRDTVFQNNEGLSFTQGARRSQVLYLAGEDGDSGHLFRALRKQGLDIVDKNIEDLPRSIHGLLDYSAIILDNISGGAFTYAAMENFEKYVKDTGGGLIMIGGDKSFGAGGYLNTPIEKAMPVMMDVPTTLEFPGFALILVIDKSASMAGSITKKNKLEGAKIAAFSAVEMLNPRDRVGVLAFDSALQWIVPVTRAEERKKIARELSTLKESGGTDLHPALQEAFRVLQGLKASKKHVIVLSDGLTNKADFASLVQAMREVKVTISTVSVGRDSDVDLMKSIAEWGGGRSYYTNDVDNIPRIFMGETKIAAKKVIVEKDMQPRVAMPGDMILGLPAETLPLVRGQVITYPKAGAVVFFETEEGPLLAAWQYGLGRSVAFTSDLSTGWGKHWVMWDHYGKFVAQMVKWAQQKEAPRNYRAEITRRWGKGTFRVDVTDDQNRFVNNLDMKLKVLFPSKSDRTIALDQVTPGRYQGNFDTEEVGEYYLSLYSSDSDGLSHSKSYGYGIPYTDEFTTSRVNDALLTRLASLTKGSMLKLGESPPNLFTSRSDVREYGPRLWPLLSLIALLLLILDVGLRKFQSLGRLR